MLSDLMFINKTRLLPGVHQRPFPPLPVSIWYMCTHISTQQIRRNCWCLKKKIRKNNLKKLKLLFFSRVGKIPLFDFCPEDFNGAEPSIINLMVELSIVREVLSWKLAFIPTCCWEKGGGIRGPQSNWRAAVCRYRTLLLSWDYTQGTDFNSPCVLMLWS